MFICYLHTITIKWQHLHLQKSELAEEKNNNDKMIKICGNCGILRMYKSSLMSITVVINWYRYI